MAPPPGKQAEDRTETRRTQHDRPAAAEVVTGGPKMARCGLRTADLLILLFQVRNDLAHTEQAHRDRNDADPVGQLRDTERHADRRPTRCRCRLCPGEGPGRACPTPPEPIHGQERQPRSVQATSAKHIRPARTAARPGQEVERRGRSRTSRRRQRTRNRVRRSRAPALPGPGAPFGGRRDT